MLNALGLVLGVPSLSSLSLRAIRLRGAWGTPVPDPSSSYHFDSSYTCGGTESPRGWSNWIIPGRLMLGQYPSTQPSPPGPTIDEALDHLALLINSQIDLFVCLMAEVPPQDAPALWPPEGVPLPGLSGVRFPGRFRRYAADADLIAVEIARKLPKYLHHPIEDLNVPSDLAGLLRLLDALLTHYEAGGTAAYVRIWSQTSRYPSAEHRARRAVS